MPDLRRKSLDDILAATRRHALDRTLGPIQLMMLGIGSTIGTGIFVLTADGTQKAGPAMIVSFVLAAIVCAATAFCYAELAAMVPVSGSAYTYSYAVMGEVVAWSVGWALILEYAVAASAIAVGWSGYVVGLAEHLLGLELPPSLVAGPYAGGVANLPAAAIALLAASLLIVGTKESAIVNAVFVTIKIVALLAFSAIALAAGDAGHFQPFAPLGAGAVVGAASTIFFAFIGFDAVSTAAEETRDPQRNVPIGLIGCLVICTAVYVVVSAAAIGAIGGQPIASAGGVALEPGSRAFAERCQALSAQGVAPLACSSDALAHVLRVIGHPALAGLMGLVAGATLPAVVLMTMYGQTRIFFAMSRDGLLPPAFTRIHPRFRTPHVVTMFTGAAVAISAAFLPVGLLSDFANSGTLFAFLVIAVAVCVLRRTEPARPRPFRAPVLSVMAPLAIAGCIGLFLYLPLAARLLFPAWTAIGLCIYLGYARRRSRLA